MLEQLNMFGGADPIVTRPKTWELPKPKNDWALSVYVLLNHPKGVTVFDAMKIYGMVKFQERLNEVLAAYPELATKKMVKVPKRLNRKVDVMLYKIADAEKATDLYITRLNHKGASKHLK